MPCTVHSTQCTAFSAVHALHSTQCTALSAGGNNLFLFYGLDFKKVTQASENFLQIYQLFILTLLSLQREQREEPKTKNYAYL